MDKLAVISGLHIYPIKSCGVISVDKAIITNHGLASLDNPNVIDRKWMIIDSNNSFISQRTHPKMALIHPRIEGDYLVISAPNKIDLKIPVKPPTTIKQCRCKDSMVSSYVYGGEIAKWLSEFLEVESLDLACSGEEFEARRLVDMNKNYQINVKQSDTTNYSDYSQFMLLGQASLDDVNTKTPYPISFLNFRPNILVNGCESYSEDDWIHIKINEVKFRKTRNCTRCLLTTVDPVKGEKSADSEPLKTLKTYRLSPENYGQSALLGINLVSDVNENKVIISIGDKILNVPDQTMNILRK